MSRRGWIFLGVGLGVAVLAVCCVGALVLVAAGVVAAPGLALGGGTAKYEIVNEGRVQAAERLRWQVDIVIDSSPPPRQWVDTVAEVARLKLKEKPELKAVLVLAYESQSQFKRRQPKVLAMVSSDGRGWNGDGALIGGFDRDGNLVADRDSGDIIILLATKVEDGEIREADRYDCQVDTKRCAQKTGTSR